MNPRIQELYEQAMEQHVSNNAAWEELNPEKFAELIVRECLEIAKNREDEFESAGLLEQSNALGNVAYGI